MYDDIKKKVFNEITKSQYISFTSDIWTCPSSHETFIPLSGHWIKKLLNAKCCTSCFAISRISHRNKYSWEIHQYVRKLGNQFNKKTANMSLGSKLVQITSVHCTVHLLQLVIKDAVLSQILVIDLLAKASRIADHFNPSSKACTEFKIVF